MALTREDLLAIGDLMDDKLSSALKPINKRLDRLEENQTRLEDRQKRLEENQTRLEDMQKKLEENQQVIRDSQLRIELEHLPRIQVALDGVAAGIEKNLAQDKSIAVLERRTEDHDIRIFALEQVVNTK